METSIVQLLIQISRTIVEYYRIEAIVVKYAVVVRMSLEIEVEIKLYIICMNNQGM